MTQKNDDHIFSLTLAPSGTEVIVMDTNGGREFQRKIASLGIYKGEVIEIVERHSQGALVVKVKGSRLAIGQEMSRKIKVKTAE